MILPGTITLQGGANAPSRSDVSEASALDCELSR